MTAKQPPPPPVASVLDDAAFEAFASCNFQEASRLAAQELLAGADQQQQQQHKEEEEEEETKGTQELGTVLIPCLPTAQNGGGGSGDTKMHIAIRLEEECSRHDKLAAILLQCAYELKREAEEILFVQYYSHQGNIPFPVALIWLQVCLAKGGAHYGTTRQVCVQLLVALEQQAGVQQEGERERDVTSMYGQAMELLVLKVMLPLGEGEAALKVVQEDKVLEARLKSSLIEACEATIKRRRALINGGGNGGGPRARLQQGSRTRGRGREGEYSSSSSPTTSTAMALTTTRRASSGFSSFFNNMWRGMGLTNKTSRQQLLVPPATTHRHGAQEMATSTITTPSSTSSNPSSSSFAISRSSSTWLALHPGSSPQQLLWTVLGFLALAIGFHLRRRGLGPRDMARRTIQLMQRLVMFVFVGGGGGGRG